MTSKMDAAKEKKPSALVQGNATFRKFSKNCYISDVYKFIFGSANASHDVLSHP